MSALAELMTADTFGRDYGHVLEPLPDDVSTDPMPWPRVVAWVVTVAVLLVWAQAVAGLYLEQWRAEA